MLIILTGNDTYTIAQKLKEIRQKFVREVDGSNLNSASLTADDFDAGVLKRELSTVPFLAKRRLIVLKQCWNAIQKQPTLAQEWQDLEDTATSTTPDSPIVVLVEPQEAGAPTKKSTARKTTASKKAPAGAFPLPAQAMKIECWVNNQNDLVRFATTLAAKHGLTFDRSALELLSQLPIDTWAAANLIETLAHCPRESTMLTKDDVHRWSTVASDDALFTLQDALGTMDRKLFLKELTQKLTAGVHPLVILTALQRTVALLMQSASNTIPSTTHPFVVKKITGQARRWSTKQLDAVAKMVFWCEATMKSSSIIPAETLLTRIGFAL
ncbi:hypothetical protein HZA86_01020 [Candidatus Uhrbacteria bacterium]|nr:hypothetical protein [Candidatus Uhrbacteria bacterium]